MMWKTLKVKPGLQCPDSMKTPRMINIEKRKLKAEDETSSREWPWGLHQSCKHKAILTHWEPHPNTQYSGCWAWSCRVFYLPYWIFLLFLPFLSCHSSLVEIECLFCDIVPVMNVNYIFISFRSS